MALDTRLRGTRTAAMDIRTRYWVAGWAILVVVASGCVYNAEKRCGSERLLQNGLCVCKPGEEDKDRKCVAKGNSGADAGCTTAAQCGDGYFCATLGLCKALPTGEGTTCAAQEDCKNYDANYCTIGYPKGATCMVSNCTGDSDCTPGRKCQDFSSIAPGTPKLCAESL
jgi:hypothetical protein